MLNNIGETFTIDYIEEDEDYDYETDKVRLIEDQNDYWHPIQCLDLKDPHKEEVTRIRWYKNGKLEK